jgi:bacillolysin
MKKVCFLLLAVLSILSAKEQRELSKHQSISLQKAETTSTQITTTNKFTHPQHVNKTLSSKETTRKRMEEDLAAVLQSLKKIQKPTLRHSAQPMAASSIRRNQNLSTAGLTAKDHNKTKIYWNEQNGTPTFIQMPAVQKSLPNRSMNTQNLQTSADNFLQSQASILKLENPAKELHLIDSEEDDLGHTHLRYQQYYKDIKVWGSDLYVHYDTAGNPSAINGRYNPTPKNVSLTFALSQEQAVARASSFLKYDANSIHLWHAEKIVFIDHRGRAAAAWHIELGETLFDDLQLFVDASTGDILHWYNNRQTGTPKKGSGVDLSGQTRLLNIYDISGTNYLVNTTKSMFNGNMGDTISDMRGIILVSDARNVKSDDFEYHYYVSSATSTTWPQNAVSLAWTFSQVYDYFKSVHGLTSLDDGTHNVTGIVNMGSEYNNAFWSGGIKLFCFGNGDGSRFTDLAGSFDIVAHEYGHGVTQYSSNLEYQFQSGALNEAFSDFTGVMAEFYADPDNGDWLIGEDCLPASSQFNCLRNLSNPHHQQSMTSNYPSKMSEYADWTIEQDNGGVHKNSTIPGHAFYQMSTRMSRHKVEKIIYRTYKHYLTRRSQFVDCRIAAIQAAKDLYPGSGTDALVAQAFDQVEIYGEKETEPEAPYEPVSGESFVLALLDDSNEILRIKSEIPFQDGAAVGFGITSSSKPSITEDGSIIAYIDMDGNVNLYDTMAEQNHPITDDGSWHNIAISPKADFVAITPDPATLPSVIGIIDMNSDQTQMRDLYIPTTTEGAEIIPEYADVLDWSIEGGWLIYDCLFSVQDQDGNPSDTWGMYLTKASSEAVIAIFQPDADLGVGNPSFSSTRDNVIAFDFIDSSNDPVNPDYYIYTYDLFSGDFGFIQQNQNTFGHPSFSPDDGKIVFQDISSENKRYLLQATMQADLLNADASSIQSWIQPVGFPVWYAMGSRPAGGGALVEEHFDDATFPPTGWTATHLAGDAIYGWSSGNVEDLNFSEHNQESLFSALCGYDPVNQQIDKLYSPAFDITGSRPTLTFWAGYNSYWTSNYEVKVNITQSGSDALRQTIWQQKVEGNDGVEDWSWRQFTVDLRPFAGSQNVRLYWEYVGQDGDLFALDDILINTDATSVAQEKALQTYELVKNYPNPFNGTTTFSYSVSQPGCVKLEIFATNGRLIETLIDESHAAGNYSQKWDADVSSGLYLYRLITPAGAYFGKTILVK